MSEERFENIWDALEDSPVEAASMRARTEFMLAIQSAVEAWSVTQKEAAARLGVTQPRMNDLLKGRVDRFSLDALMNLAHAAGLTVAWQVTKSAA